MTHALQRGPMWLCLFFLFLAFASHAVEADGSYTLKAPTGKSFADVVEDLEFMVTEHNFRIVGRNRIGKGIRERGNADFPDYQIVQICNLSYAETILQLDPGWIRYMPCNLAVYEQDKGIYVTTTLLPTDVPDPQLRKVATEINDVLKNSLQYAAD